MADSSTLRELETWLLAAAIGLTSTSLSRTKMPDAPHVMTTIYESQGQGDDLAFGGGIQFEYPRIQVVCRGEPEDHDTPRLQIEKIRQAMATGLQTTQLSGTDWLVCTPIGNPFPMGEDGKGRVKLACNFQVQKRPSRTA